MKIVVNRKLLTTIPVGRVVTRLSLEQEVWGLNVVAEAFLQRELFCLQARVLILYQNFYFLFTCVQKV